MGARTYTEVEYSYIFFSLTIKKWREYRAAAGNGGGRDKWLCCSSRLLRLVRVHGRWARSDPEVGKRRRAKLGWGA
jgi:hypothetical protein